MGDILHILKYKAKSFFKLSTELKPQNILKMFASLLVFGGFAFTAYLFAQRVTVYLLDEAHIGVFLLHRFMSMTLYVFFLSVNVGNLIVSYATLYRSKETFFFLTKPISHSRVFFIKFLDNFFYSSGTLFLMAMSVLAGYGSYFHLSPIFFVEAMVLLFIPYMLLSATVAVVALMMMMKVAERVGVKNIFVGIVLGYVLMIVLYFKMMDPLHLVNQVMSYAPHTNQHFGFLDPPLLKFLPNHWIAEALYWHTYGETSATLLYAGLLLVVTALAMLGMMLFARQYFYSSWLASLDLRAQAGSRATSKGWMSLARKPVLESQVDVLMRKEFWQFFREPSQWVHLGIVTFLVLMFIGSLVQVDLRANQPMMQTIAYFVVYIFAAFLISSIALRFVYPMISAEGEAFWLVRSAPIKLTKVYWLKYLIAVVPVFLFNEALGVAAHQSLKYYGVLLDVTIVSIFCITPALVSLNLSAGTFFSNFKDTNPIRVASSQGATLTFLISLVYLVFLVGILFVPLYQYFEAMIYGKHVNLQLIFTAMAVIVLGSLLMTIISSSVGLRAIRRG